MNPCRNAEWLSYHYSRRDDYVSWCEENDVEVCPYGGQGLALTKCGELAGVSAQCISNWLYKFEFGTRSIAEAQLGESNHRYGMRAGVKVRRASRDSFFEEYRAGIINIIMGGRNFSNGKPTTKEETTARRARRRAATPQ